MLRDSACERASSWIARSSSVVLSAGWISYWLYLLNTGISKQSVLMGEITFYAAVLLTVTCLSVTSMGLCLGFMAATHSRLLRSASLWALGSLFIACLVFVSTRALIERAS